MTHALTFLLLACAAAQPVETSAEPTTHLYVRTTPAGAQILLDGKELGTSPGVFPVKPGERRRLVIELDGQVAEEQQITIRDGRITRIELALAPPEPDATSESPPDAEVETRSVRKKISDFPEPVDLSTPESACAAHHRASATMDGAAILDLSWVDIGPEERKRFASLGVPSNFTDEQKAQLEAAEILKVLNYKKELAAVVSRLDFPNGKAWNIFSLKTFGQIDGKWKLVSQERCASLETAVSTFHEKRDRLWQRFQETRKVLAAAPVAGPGPARKPRPTLDQPLAFGPVIEQVLQLPRGRKGELLDLDTGRRAMIDKFGEDDRETHRRVRKQGVDVSAGAEHGLPGALLFDAAVVEISNDKWETITPKDVVDNWHLKQQEPLPITTLANPDVSKLPLTCLFETREGSLGVFQLVGVANAEKGTARIRYKLVEADDDEAAIREVVSKFVEAALQDDPRTAATFLTDKMSSNSDKQVREAVAAGLKMSAIEEVHLAQNRALVATQFARIRDRKTKEPVCTVYSLSKRGTGWAIDDIDMEDEQGLADEIRRFRETAHQRVTGEPRGPSKELVSLTFEVDEESVPDAEPVDVDKLLEAIRGRLDRGWVGRVEVRPVGRQQIEVIAFTTDPEQVRRIERLVQSPGTIEFRVLANERDHKELIERARKEEDKRVLNPDGSLAAWWVPLATEQPPNRQTYQGTTVRTIEGYGGQISEVLVVADPFDVTDTYLVEATAGEDASGRPCVQFAFNSRGGQLLGGLTGANLPDKSDGFSRRLGIILNGRLHSFPAIRTTIHDRGEITGSFTREEAEDLAGVLNSGALPLPLEKVSELRTSR